MYSSTTSFSTDYQSCLLDNFSVSCIELDTCFSLHFLNPTSQSSVIGFLFFLDIFKKLVSGICLGKSICVFNFRAELL